MKNLSAGIAFLRTHDLGLTARFYEETLGLRLALDQGGCRIYGIAGRAYVGFCEREGGLSTDGIILTLVTEDVDAWYERLSDRDVEILKRPEFNADYKIYHFFLRDPSGYLIEIQRFEDPRWAAEVGHQTTF